MLILWILLGSAALFVVQRAIYTEHWDKKIRISFRFLERAVTEGEDAGILERTENRKLLSLPTFGYRYEISRNFAAASESGSEPVTLKRKLVFPAEGRIFQAVA